MLTGGMALKPVSIEEVVVGIGLFTVIIWVGLKCPTPKKFWNTLWGIG